MKSFSFFAAFAALFLAVSCTDRNPVPVDDYSQAPEINKDSTRFTCKRVSWLGGQNEYYDDIAFRADQIDGTVSDGPSVIFVDMSAANANLGNLIKSYDDGSVIIISNPDMKVVDNMMQRSGWYHMVPTTDDIALFAFSKNGAYAVHKPESITEIEGTTDLEPGTEATYGDEAEDLVSLAPDPYSDCDFTELSYYLGPFVEWVNRTTSGKINGDLDGYAMFSDQKNYNLELYVHHVALSGKDYIKGPYSVSVNYKYKPIYVFADQNYNPGDYYLFDASYVSETGKIFQGNDFTHKHGGITVHICGAFLRELNVLTYIDGDGNNPKFIAGSEPIPESDINTKNYSNTRGWNIGGGVTGGYSKKDGASISASFDWGVSNSNTVSYTVSDLGVRNNTYTDYEGHGAAPAWTFLGQNLPGPKGDKGFNGNTPEIARSTGTFHTSWVWYSGSHAEWDTEPLGDIVTVFNPVLGGAHNGLCVDGEKNTWKINEVVSRVRMVAPFRIPFGTARINNTFQDGAVISDVEVVDCQTGSVKFTSFGDFSQSKPCEFSVPEGKYDITLNVTGTDHKTVRYKISNPIQLKRRTAENDIYDIDASIRFIPE